MILQTYKLINTKLSTIALSRTFCTFLCAILGIAFIVFWDKSLALCMDAATTTQDCVECAECVTEPALTKAKYTICDVRYDREGRMVLGTDGSPKEFCNLHDSPIAAILDRALASIDRENAAILVKHSKS